MRGFSKKNLVVVMTVVLGLVSLAVMSRVWPKRNKNAPAPAVEISSLDPAASAEPPGPKVSDVGAEDVWAVGTRRSYEADFRSSLATMAGPTGVRSNDGSFALRGKATLSLTAQAVDEARVVLRGQIDALALTAGTDRSNEKHIEESIRAEMARPFLVKIRRTGHVESIALDRDTKGLGCNILRGLVAPLGFVAPEGDDPDWGEWVTQESDQNGIFKARYRQIEPGIFQKTKLEYSHVESESRLRVGDSAARVTIVSSAKIRRDRQGVVQSVESDEHMKVPIGDASFQSDSHVNLRLARRETAPLAALDLSRLRETPLYTDRPAADRGPVDEARRKRELLGGATLQQLFTQLERTPDTRDNWRARWDVTRRMSALFDLEPERLAEMGEKLKGKIDPANADMLLAAVSDSKAPEAQSTLAALAKDADADPRLRTAATTHLGLQERPTEQTFSNLTKLADESKDDATRKSAALALGSAARQAREGGQTGSASQQAIDYLNNALSGAQDPESRRLALEALGNAADPSSLPAIEKALHDPDPLLRRTAVLALRLFPGGEVDALIAGAFGDADNSVRSGAMIAFSSRQASRPMVDALISVLKSDEDPGLRVQAASLLGRRGASFPEVVATLEWAKSNDPNPDVQKAAAAALQTKGTSTSPRR